MRNVSVNEDAITAAVRQWLESVVVDLNLCPFAKRELVRERVRFSVTAATSDVQLLMALERELEFLNQNASVETTLLIHPQVLQSFNAYNQFLSQADGLLVQMNLEGVYQVASFHPDYQFGGTAPDDVENYTNRSPYPVLHLLREETLAQVIADSPDIDEVPVRNIALMNRLGRDKMQAMLQACLDSSAGVVR
jgi:hypothetical protein